MTTGDLIIIDAHLTRTVPSYPSDKARLATILARRTAGHIFTIDECVESMVRAILTNSVPWARIAPHIASGRITSIFHSYSAATLKTVPYMDLVHDLRKIKCGNPSDVAQMRALADNIKTLERIISTHGSIEAYFSTLCPTTYPQITYSALKDFDTSGRYKLGQMGIPLVCEFLKNMGFLLPKPDRHLKRFFSGDRMGTIAGSASNADVFNQIETLARSSTFTIPEIDLMVWSFCAKGYGDICTKSPKCHTCPFNRLNGGSCVKP